MSGYRPVQRSHVEQLALDCLGILLQTSVSAKTCAGGSPKLAANALFLPGNVLDAFSNKLVVSFVVRLCLCVGPALGGREDLKL